MTILNNEEILKIYKHMASGPGSAMATHDVVDTVMEELIGEKNFTEDKYQLTNKQIQVMIGVIQALVERVNKYEGNNEENKTNSGTTPVQETNDVEIGGREEERRRPEIDNQLDDNGDMSEVPRSFDTPSVQPSGETNNEHRFYSD